MFCYSNALTNQLSVCLPVILQDSKISSMERGLRDLEEEIQMLKSNGALSTEEREEEMKQMEVYRSHSKFMKNKVLRGQMAALCSPELSQQRGEMSLLELGGMVWVPRQKLGNRTDLIPAVKPLK